MARQHVERLRINPRHRVEGGGGGRGLGADNPVISEDSRSFDEGGSLHEELVEELVQVRSSNDLGQVRSYYNDRSLGVMSHKDEQRYFIFVISICSRSPRVSHSIPKELIVTPELILTIIAPLEAALLDWFKAQAAETLKDRLSKDEFQDTVNLMSDDSTIRFFATCINFMHEEYVKTTALYDERIDSKVKRMSRVGSLNRFRKTPGSSKPQSSISRWD